MADNTIIQALTANGDTISTEDIGGGLKLPRSKLAIGFHGTDLDDIYATLETLDAFTPTNGQGLTLTLAMDQD